MRGSWARAGWVAAALVAASPFAHAASDVAMGAGAMRASAALDFSISVPHVMQLRVLGQPAALQVTADDIARGTITVSGAQLDLLVNDRDGYVIRAQLANPIFTAAKVLGLPGALVAGDGATTLRMASMVGRPRPAPMPVSYELQLAPGTTPGQYSWPVALSLEHP
ncbi:MAG TPA: hypothetical protein VLJ84_06195 [Usitatibacter sp.]|nr:hypothetical protein [Usitatibacter sp.]